MPDTTLMPVAAAPAARSTQPAASRAADPTPRQKAQDRELAALLQSWPEEIADRSVDGLTRTVARLRRALRDERQRGLAGHWIYSVARHAALARHYARQVEALRDLTADLTRSARPDAPAAPPSASRTELRLAHGRPVPIPARPPHPGRIRVRCFT